MSVVKEVPSFSYGSTLWAVSAGYILAIEVPTPKFEVIHPDIENCDYHLPPPTATINRINCN
jgi:hypothetical protein